MICTVKEFAQTMRVSEMSVRRSIKQDAISYFWYCGRILIDLEKSLEMVRANKEKNARR
jgi:hypothetical protein